MGVPEAAALHYKEMQRLQVLAVAAARRSWSRVDPRFLSESWTRALWDLTPVVSAVQVRAATAGASYGADSLAAQGVYVAPEAFVNPQTFGGYAADGRSLTGALYSPITDVKTWIGGGYSAQQALSMGRSSLDGLMRTTVADAGRQAASVDVTSRKGVGYVRMLNPPSCSRCVVLAGKFFRWNTGFRRHPRCDCVHVMSTAGSTQGARDEGLISDPYDYFKGLSKSEQNSLWGQNNAQAIRDGADISQVTNASRGTSGLMTTEGATRRGAFGQSAEAQLTHGRRMTPDAIYRLNGTDRAAAMRDLERYGYILPGGQNPLGSIVGQREGFGALGRGGTRKAASQAVLDARATGVRDGSRYAMTEAERRLYDAKSRWEMVQKGYDPYASPAFGNTPDPTGRLRGFGATSASGWLPRLDPQTAASVERDYRRWLASGGQKFTQ